MNNLHERIETKLSQVLDDKETPARLQEAMRYAVLGGGKRIRPLLVYTTGQCFHTPLELLDTPALAVELIHCYSLIHDDLPAMDNDQLRRGKPTTHLAFDEATAILAGDALLNKAFELLAKPTPQYNPSTQLQLLDTLSQASGSQGMIGGQLLDIESENQHLSQAKIEHMHQLKTGKLIHASILLGAICAQCSPTQLTPLNQFAKAIGLAFQLKDDLLDANSTTAELGKTAGLDKRNHKASALLDTRTLNRRADELLACAKQHLQTLPINSDSLIRVAEYIVKRNK